MQLLLYGELRFCFCFLGCSCRTRTEVSPVESVGHLSIKMNRFALSKSGSMQQLAHVYPCVFDIRHCRVPLFSFAQSGKGQCLIGLVSTAHRGCSG